MAKWRMIFVLLLSVFMFHACALDHQETNNSIIPDSQRGDVAGSYTLEADIENINSFLDYSDSDLEKVYFAGGCFWGVEAFMNRIYGVHEVQSGYANGTGTNPSYQDVIQGDAGFAEAVEVVYDPERVDLTTLVDDLFLVIDPTSKNKQGNDVGIQYRTGIYATDDAALTVIQEAVKVQQKVYEQEIVTEVALLDNFYLAEEEHQDYLEKNPNGYCHIDLRVADKLAVQPIENDVSIIQAHSE